MYRHLLFRLKTFIPYFIQAKTAHGVHSPFVYRIIKEAIEPSRKFRLQTVESIRKKLLNDYRILDMYDLKSEENYRVTVSKIAKTSLSKPKFSAFLHQLIEMLQVQTVLETGTNLGINAFYLAGPQLVKQVITIEASPILAAMAKNQFAKLLQHKVIIKEGLASHTFKPCLIKYSPEFVFLDADHRSSVILQQVEDILLHCLNIKCIVIHDIYWSPDMQVAWNHLVADSRFPLTIDMYQAGLLFTEIEMPKQHFTLRF